MRPIQTLRAPMSASKAMRFAPRILARPASALRSAASTPLQRAAFPIAVNRHHLVVPSTIQHRAMSTKLDDHQRAQILQTWRIIEKDLDTHAVTFYKNMVADRPNITQLFVNRNEYGFLPEDSEAGLKRHSIDVMVMIGHAVAGLNDLESIAAELKELAERHAKYGVELEHFPIMKDALFVTLEQELGPKWTPEVKAAWESAYATCEEMMEGPLAKEHERLGNYKSTEYMRPEKPH